MSYVFSGKLTDDPRLWHCEPGEFVLAPESLLPELEVRLGFKTIGPATPDEVLAAKAWMGCAMHVRYMKRRITLGKADTAYLILAASAQAEQDKAVAETKRIAADARADVLIRRELGEPG